ncbi:uncharacterized protein LOC120626257 isoform X2 [Pararge aegeria]|uniref:uncharacterized protein LOC120626257 isoform X2 n=1 Tax=Pararge aegeria TaxID=116150 RepID=UPI0019CF8C81|nr:uncharacterized protein LOC120626257 isoform X2 [Pararge aegeria]
MPERPKRRKNKNKRKNNKNSSTDVNKNNIEQSEIADKSCSSVTQNVINKNALHAEEENTEIKASSEICDTFNEIDKSITTFATELVTKEDSVIAESPQFYGESSSTSMNIDSTVLVQGEELNKKVCSGLNENGKSDAENKGIEKESNKSVTSDVYSRSLISQSNANEQNVLQTYIVETPDQVASTKIKCKLDNAVKSKSCDNDDCPTIVEIIDDSNVQSDQKSGLSVIDNSNVIISGEESDIEWEKVNHFNLPQTQLIKGILSSDTIPLNIVHCEQIKSLSPQEELSLRNYLQTLNLSTCSSNMNAGDIKTEIEEIINREIKYRLRKKGLTEDTFIRAGPCRSLAVIDEEGSGDSSKTSRRHSYLSDKKSDNEELEDEVFECKPTHQLKNADISLMANRTNKRLIPQPCIRVDAKLKEPEISEARGDWSMKTVERLTGAELVYLTDSSSSTSSIYDLNDEADNGEETDASVRMITPTIEVTDTESLLSNTFLTHNKDQTIISKSCDNVCEVASEPPTADKETKEVSGEVTESNLKQDNHEIIILSTDDIKTNLFVKDINETRSIAELEELCGSHNSIPKDNSEELPISSLKSSTGTDIYDLEIKVLKCELNNAINNLIKEVISDSENCQESTSDTFTRQDSSSSLDSSQCTAKYNPTNSSLNDVSNILKDDTCDSTNKDNSLIDTAPCHVKEVLQCVTTEPSFIDTKLKDCMQPAKLRDICVKKISSFPFGDKILEELAHVSLRLQNMSALVTEHKEPVKLSMKNKCSNVDKFESRKSSEHIILNNNESNNVPPPILPRKSSLRIAQDEPIKFVTSKAEPKYECLSPSQKMLMEKTNTTIERDFNNQTKVSPMGRTGNTKERKINPPIIPTSIPTMKSETGSRLLALLRDTSLSNNLNTQTLEDKIICESPTVKHHSFEKHMKTYSESLTTRFLNEIDSTNLCEERTSDKKSFSSIIQPSTLKPLPPPKPKKLSTYFYESDEGSNFRENSFRTMRSNKKYFHYSTGNLNKEIEDDISSIQDMHRYCTNLRDQSFESSPRRPSLPKDLCDQQMEYICQKEKEVDAELRRLELEQNKPIRNRGPRAPMLSNNNHIFDSLDKTRHNNNNLIPTPEIHKKTGNSKLCSLFSSSQEELLREKMYLEYVNQMAEREQRKQQKVIKVTQTPINSTVISKSMPIIDHFDSKSNNRIEQEFISRAKERWYKLGIRDPETEDEKDIGNDLYVEPKVIEHKIKVIESGEEKDVKKLPSHMQEFVKFTVKDKGEASGSTAIWRPGAPPGGEAPSAPSPGAPPPPPPPPVWTPGSATASPQTLRKSFRPVHFEDTPPPRRKFESSDQNGCTSGSESEGRLRTSQSAPATGLNTLGSSTSSRLPRAQNPTVTLLQKAREGQISRAQSNIQSPREENHRLARDRPSPPRTDAVHALRKDYASESEAERSDFERSSHRMTEAKKKIEGIGPTTKDGMPVTLRSEVKDPSKWYKKMYDTIHKNKYDEDYVTIRYKNRRGETLQRPSSNRSQYAYFDPRSGYLSEPEGGLNRLASSTWSDAYDSDVTSGPRRRTASVQEDRRHDDVPAYLPNNKYSTLASARARQEVYKNQPGRIENYVPGRSSVIDKEAKQWWDEVMDIFDGWLDDNSPLPPYSTLLARAIQKSQNESNALSQSQASPKEKKDITSAILSKSNMARALKESGYESDSTLVFRRRDDGTEGPLSPAERRAAYRDLQAGGEPPLRGFRSPAPPRQENDTAPEPPRRASHGSFSDSESPSRRYVESDVNIHYRCPVRHDPLPLVPERELAIQQAEHMKRLYREQRRNKYLQENNIQHADIDSFDASIKELQDMQNRRHQDNFMPSQKTVVPLNRYDEAEKIVAKALYTFNGQTARELSFRKGDIINVRKQIDSNWYEGEVHGKVGLFPYNYVELLKGEGVQTHKKPAVVEGRARAKFDFIAQTNLELPLKKGEVVVLSRRIDHNWWEGRNANRTGIFPDSYITILQEPSPSKPETQPLRTTDKPVASPAAHGLLNGTDKRSMGSHSYTPQPNSPALSNAPPATQPLSGYVTKSSQGASASERGYGPPTGAGVDLNNTEPLYVDTNAEAVPYRAMYKYRPQNPDELELNEGDTVYVLEKCDDGWYVGSSQRTGRFGTFPGNYVERI